MKKVLANDPKLQAHATKAFGSYENVEAMVFESSMLEKGGTLLQRKEEAVDIEGATVNYITVLSTLGALRPACTPNTQPSCGCFYGGKCSNLYGKCSNLGMASTTVL